MFTDPTLTRTEYVYVWVTQFDSKITPKCLVDARATAIEFSTYPLKAILQTDNVLSTKVMLFGNSPIISSKWDLLKLF